MGSSATAPVLVLGAGINGAAVARELVLNGLPVCVVDLGDLAGGTTAYSSRLIHGGLRYLEYAEFRLVRESLQERKRLLTLAPQFVQPLRFHIPLIDITGGFWSAVSRFLGGRARGNAVRGLLVVRLGLWMYDLLVLGDQLPASRLRRRSRVVHPQVDPERFRWMCSYSDAQILYPERMVVSLLTDAAQCAARQGLDFAVHTYCQAVRDGARVRIENSDGLVRELGPSAIINATGAWLDATLQQLQVRSPRLIGGTKGSHLFTWQERLRDALNGEAVYTEAADGRPVFILPWRDGTLIGTTDMHYDAPPETAVASQPEIEYLLDTVNQLVPAAEMKLSDIALHYSGVRPLPYTAGGRKTAAITRRHALVSHRGVELPVYSIVGGKLTTCRSLAEETVHTFLRDRGRTPSGSSRHRSLPGADGLVGDAEQREELYRRRAATYQIAPQQVQAMYELCGSRADALFEAGDPADEGLLRGTHLPLRFVRQVIRQEWVVRLEDLVERRLMLLYERGLSLATLQQLAGLLVEEHKLAMSEVQTHVERCVGRLSEHFGRQLN